MTKHALGWTAALLLPLGAAAAGPGIAHDDTIYPDDLLAASKARRVEVVLTDRGPVPSVVPHGREKLELVVRRASAGACRGDLLIPEYDLRTPAPGAEPVSVPVLAPGKGAFRITCPREDVPEPAPVAAAGSAGGTAPPAR